jgi:hypothetical protein
MPIAPAPEGSRNPLMHGVEVRCHDIEVASGRQKALQARLQRVQARDRLRIVPRGGWKMHAPPVGRAFPMKQVRPFLGVGDVVALRIPVAAEIVGDLDVERAIRIGEALEIDPKLLAHDAARAFAADDERARNRLGLAGFIDDFGDDAVGVLRESRKRRHQPQIDERMRLGHRHPLFDDLDPLALEHIGKARVVLEMAVVERGDERVRVMVPVVKDRRNDAPRLEPLI